MTKTDARGLAVSTPPNRSIEQYEAALHLLNGYYGDPLAAIDAVVKEDPGFAMGHALRAALMVTSGDGTVAPMLRQSVETGEALHAQANDRERRHIAAARACLDGGSTAARCAHHGGGGVDRWGMRFRRIATLAFAGLVNQRGGLSGEGEPRSRIEKDGKGPLQRQLLSRQLPLRLKLHKAALGREETSGLQRAEVPSC
jgi:phage tail protein X